MTNYTVNAFFIWMSEWKTAPAHTVAGLHEIY